MLLLKNYVNIKFKYTYIIIVGKNTYNTCKKFVDKKNKICYNERGDSAFVESLKGRMRRGL